jgi:hypothetical protein
MQIVLKAVFTAFIGKRDSVMLPASSGKCASTEHQLFFVMYLRFSVRR